MDDLTTITLKNADASTMSKLLVTVFNDSPHFRAVPDSRTNTLIITASEADLTKVKKLIEILDKAESRRP